jgi:hypothetical protein
MLAKVGCMLEAFDFRELVMWCAKRFDSKYRVVNTQEDKKTLIPLRHPPSSARSLGRLRGELVKRTQGVCDRLGR